MAKTYIVYCHRNIEKKTMSEIWRERRKDREGEREKEKREKYNGEKDCK